MGGLSRFGLIVILDHVVGDLSVTVGLSIENEPITRLNAGVNLVY